MNRRSFVKTVAGSAAAAMGPALAQPSAPHKAKQTIGIQIGGISFLDEGTEKTFDTLQERAYVNTIFLAAFTYGHGIAGRQLQGHPLPDHGVQDYNDNFHGGLYTTPHMQYYKDTVLKDFRAPDYGKVDVLDLVLPEAKKRGIKTYTWSEDVWRADVPNIEKCQEVDLYGRKAHTMCFNNPDHHNFLLGMHEDWVRSYDIDGIMWGSERYGAFGNMIESIHNRKGNDPTRVTCFCSFCQAKARDRGINPARAIEGFKALENWVRTGRGGGKPVDGHYVALWRILFRYPEILAWETMWNDSVHETYDAIYKKVKSIKPEVQVGWHVWHAHGFSPFFRAQTDLKELAKYSDYVKMTVYHNLGGTRMETYINSCANTTFGDIPKDEALQFIYRVMNYRERGLDELPYTGLSPDYVYRETKRCVEDAAGTNMQIWPGIDVDIPLVKEEYSKCTPPVMKEVTMAAYRGGAQGLVISRKYSEMKLANLSAVGEGIRAMNIAG